MKQSTIALDKSIMIESSTGSKMLLKSPKTSKDKRIGTTNGQAEAEIAAQATPITKHIGT